MNNLFANYKSEFRWFSKLFTFIPFVRTSLARDTKVRNALPCKELSRGALLSYMIHLLPSAL